VIVVANDINMEYKLTSSKAVIGLYLGTLVVLLFTPIVYFQLRNMTFHVGILIAILVYILLLSFIAFQFLYLCHAEVKGDVLILKKQFRAKKIYSFDKIGSVSSFRLKRTTYVNFTMTNADGTIERYLIARPRSIFSTDVIDIKQTLINLRDGL